MPQAVRISQTGQVIDTPAKVSKRQNDDVLWIATEGGGPLDDHVRQGERSTKHVRRRSWQPLQ